MERPRINYKRASRVATLAGLAALGVAAVSGVIDQEPAIKGTVVNKSHTSFTNRTLFLVTPWERYPLWTEPNHDDYILKLKECDIRQEENDCDAKPPIDIYVSADIYDGVQSGEYVDYTGVDLSQASRVER